MYEKNITAQVIAETLKSMTEETILRPVEIADATGAELIAVYKEIENSFSDALYPVIEQYCPFCGKRTEKTYNTVAEIPDALTCPHCGKTSDDLKTIMESAFVAYKKKG